MAEEEVLVGLTGGGRRLTNRRAVRGELDIAGRNDVRLDRLVDDRAAEEEGEGEGGGDAQRSCDRRLLCVLIGDAALDRHPLPRPEGIRLLDVAGRGLAHLAVEPFVTRGALLALREVHHYRHRLARLGVVRLEQIGFTEVFHH